MDLKYREYLISKKWNAIKIAVHYLYDNKCFICQDEIYLHVHHKNYDRLYHEDLDDLVLLCWNYHKIVHDWTYTKEEAYEKLLDWTHSILKRNTF